MRWPTRTRSGLLEVAVLGAVGVAIVILLALGTGVAKPSDIHPLPTGGTIAGRIPIIGSQHRYLFQPGSAAASVGVKYRFEMRTQCGLADPVGPDFDGSFWDPIDPRQAGGGSPAGFNAPVDTGYMVLLSATVAEYHSSQGATARFHRHAGTVIASLCE